MAYHRKRDSKRKRSVQLPWLPAYYFNRIGIGQVCMPSEVVRGRGSRGFPSLWTPVKALKLILRAGRAVREKDFSSRNILHEDEPALLPPMADRVNNLDWMRWHSMVVVVVVAVAAALMVFALVMGVLASQAGPYIIEVNPIHLFCNHFTTSDEIQCRLHVTHHVWEATIVESEGSMTHRITHLLLLLACVQDACGDRILIITLLRMLGK